MTSQHIDNLSRLNKPCLLHPKQFCSRCSILTHLSLSASCPSSIGTTESWPLVTVTPTQPNSSLLAVAPMRLRIRGSALPKKSQLLRCMGGAGGTGKSRVIDALKDLFQVRGEVHRAVFTASSGGAAANIGGSTIRSAVNIAFGGIHEIETRRVQQDGHSSVWQEKILLIGYWPSWR